MTLGLMAEVLKEVAVILVLSFLVGTLFQWAWTWVSTMARLAQRCVYAFRTTAHLRRVQPMDGGVGRPLVGAPHLVSVHGGWRVP